MSRRNSAAALLAVALSAISAAVLLYGVSQSWEQLPLITMTMGGVVIATVVGTLWAGRVGLVAGPVLGAAPLSIIFVVAALIEDDPFGLIAAAFVTFLALVSSALPWSVILITRPRRSG